MTELGVSVFQDNDEFVKQYPKVIALTNAARSKRLKHPSTGIEDTLPNVVGQVIAEYMTNRQSQEYANAIIAKFDKTSEWPRTTDEFVNVMSRFNNSAYALHSVVIHLRSNGYIDDGFARKLADCNAKRLRLEEEHHNSKEEIERLRSLVRVLHGNPDKIDPSMSGDVAR